MWSLKAKNEISIVISGEAGQGIQTLEDLLLKIMKSSGYHVFAYSEFMSRIRGGNNSMEIRIASDPVQSFVDRIDIFIPLGADAVYRFKERITSDTLIISQPDYLSNSPVGNMDNTVNFPLEETAKDIGGKIYLNVFILGMISALMKVDAAIVREAVRVHYQKLTEDKLEKNLAAVDIGYAFYTSEIKTKIDEVLIDPDVRNQNKPVLYGSEAIGIGSLAGGCNFISAYPMSPSTNVLVYLAGKSEKFGIVAEQAEDEIAAINMAIGAWYAGARAMVTTSGGGFALMVEAISLAGCMESPVVVHIGQRPGPATGMPTRTEQGDLLFALFSGQGEFPRLILAPGNKNDGINLACHAFNMADKYQIPVIILTDQYYLDSANDVGEIDLDNLKEEKYLTKTSSSYQRYKLTDDGVSPRGIPGWGEGIVCAGGDEHTEKGYNSEDFDIRINMVNKRLKKLDSLKSNAVIPRFISNEKYKYLLVSWGSTLETVTEALRIMNNRDIALLHFTQVYPLPDRVSDILKKAEKTVIIENNATSQFGKIIKLETGFDFDYKILKYNGMPFSVEEIVKKVTAFIK